MKAKEKYLELKKDRPNLDAEMINTFLEDMPYVAMATLDKIEYGKHIVSDEIAQKGISYIKNKKGESVGAKWTLDDILGIAKNYINIDEEAFYPLDLYVWANVKYADYSHITTEATYIIKMAIADLKDEDFPFYPADERPYCWVMAHLKEEE